MKVLREINPYSTWKIWTQRRYVLGLMVFLGNVNVYSLRSNLSIAILAMTQDRFISLENGTQMNIGPEFSWDNIDQGYLLSSFFYGYITTHILGGILAAKFGGKRIFGGGIVCTACITVLSPWLADINLYVLLIGRILGGICEGVTFSCLYSMWNKWIPPQERGKILAFANSGAYIGAVFSMLFYAYLVTVAGWRSVFWFSGGMGFLWCVFWFLIITETPESDPRISKAEIEYIQLSLGDCKAKKMVPVPWKDLFSSKAIWAINVAIFCEQWGYLTLLTLLPKYFYDVFQVEIFQSGLLSALPYVSVAVMVQIVGRFHDHLRRQKWLTVSQISKIFIIISFLAQSSFIMGAAFWGNQAGTVFCLIMAVASSSLAVIIIAVYSLNIAPQHSGVVLGIANTFGTAPGIISPIVAGYIVSTDNSSAAQWRNIFYITVVLYLLGAIFFTIFGSGLRQKWDYEDSGVKKERSDTNN